MSKFQAKVARYTKEILKEEAEQKMAKVNIEMSECQAKEITDELKNQVADVSNTLPTHHLEYQWKMREHDIDAEEIQETVHRLNVIGSLIKLIEEAEQEVREVKNGR